MSSVDDQLTGDPPTPIQLQKLLQVYLRRVRGYPADLVLRAKLAEVLRLLDRRDDAIAIYSGIAWAQGVAGNLGQAILICKMILEMDPQHAATQVMLSRLFAFQEIREQKHAVQVDRIGERWVADPRQILISAGPFADGGVPPDLSHVPSPPDSDRRTAASTPTPPIGEDDRGVSHGPALVASSGAALPVIASPAAQLSPLATRPTLVDNEAAPAIRTRTTRSYQTVSRSDSGPAADPSSDPPLDPAPDPAGDPAATALPPDPAVDPCGGPALDLAVADPAPDPPGDPAPPLPVASTADAPLVGEKTSVDEPAFPPSLALSSIADNRHATVKMQPSLQSSMLRKDAEQAFISQRPDAPASLLLLQREVREASRRQGQEASGKHDTREDERRLQATLAELRKSDQTDDDGREKPPDIPLSIFSDLDVASFQDLVAHLEHRYCPAQTLVFREGDPGDSLFLVCSGTLQVMKEPEDGAPAIQLARLGSGAFFGEFGLLTDGRRHASVRCLEDCELLELRREVLVALGQAHPDIIWTLRSFYQQRVIAMVLATAPLFQVIRPEERKSVLARFSLQRFMEDEIIIAQGKRGPGFFVILVGEVTVRHASRGKEVALGQLCEGEYFGEMSLLSGNMAGATVQATRITEVLMLSPESFYELAAEHPAVWAVLQQEAERRRLATSEQLTRTTLAAGDICLI